jgi:hypothetical protein
VLGPVVVGGAVVSVGGRTVVSLTLSVRGGSGGAGGGGAGVVGVVVVAVGGV